MEDQRYIVIKFKVVILGTKRNFIQQGYRESFRIYNVL